MKIAIEASNVNKSGIHPSVIGWKNSRPDHKEIDASEILKIDLPVNEMPMATLFIESTIVEREIFASMRNHVMWAQGTRVQNVLDFEYPDCIADMYKELFEQKRSMMSGMKNIGIRQDEYRKLVPIFSNTKYTINISMRDLISVLNEFRRIEKAAFSPSAKLVFAESIEEITKLLIYQFGLSTCDINSYKPKDILHETSAACNGMIGGTLVATTKLPLMLRAQVVRHRKLICRDNLMELICLDNAMELTNDSEVEMQISGLEEDWIDVVRKRSCWMAQYDLWSDLINKVESSLRLGESSLPCHDGACPYNGDATGRLNGDDPNAPCPKHALINSIDVTPEQVEDMIGQFDSDKRPMFWETIIADSSGVY